MSNSVTIEVIYEKIFKEISKELGDKISKDYAPADLKVIKSAHIKVDEKELESLKGLED